MRVKELNNRVVHIAWSPESVYPTYLAAGTAAENVESGSKSVSARNTTQHSLS